MAASAMFAAVGCSDDPAAAPPTGAQDGGGGGADGGPEGGTRQYKACMCSDQPGSIDDNSFAGTAAKGLAEVGKMPGWTTVSVDPTASTLDAYAAEIDKFIASDCDLVIAIGFLMVDAVKLQATQYPKTSFLELDNALDPPLENVWAQKYVSNQASFLAGYVAAGTTKTGKVATFGGAKFPSVTDLMDGFVLGVQYYNSKNNTTVAALGWDVAAQDGVFTEDFTDVSKGEAKAKEFLDQGADIIFPVAGGVGFGAANAVKIAGNSWIVGVDTDWGVRDDIGTIVLTSVLKKLDVSVVKVAKSVQDGSFKGGTYQGGLAENEVDISPFHSSESKVSQAVKDALPAIRQGIKDGTIKTTK
jgi:basic membrane protein A